MNIQLLQNQIRKDNLAFGMRMTLIMSQPQVSHPGEPFMVWRSNRFLAQLFRDEFTMRLTINRTSINHDGGWEDGITWDELQQVKSECGYAHMFAVEVYPADAHLINDSNMRHLFLLLKPPPFAWIVNDAEAVAEVAP